MPSPFPGIDPFIEAQGHWPDFHTRFLTYCCDALDDRLPEDYAARMGEKVHLVRNPDEPPTALRPDIVIVKDSRTAGSSERANGIATLDPVTVPLTTSDFEEVREVWIEIRRLPDLSLVTVIELLAPSNKIGDGRHEHLDKRRLLIEQPVHLVELDLLIGGRRLPMKRPLPAGDAYAIVSRSERRPDSEVYMWTLRDGLPTIPIPLDAPDPDIPLDLAPAFATAYRRGRYARVLRYQEPYPIPLAAADRDWVEATTRRDRG